MKAWSTALAALVLAGFAATPAQAQKYPDRSLTWIVPFGPGTVTDNSARVVARALSEKIGQNVIVENKPGAAGIVGTEFVASAKPDGYTFLYGSSGPMATYPSLYKKLSYSPLKSFTPVHAMAESPLIVCVRTESPIKTLADLVDYGKKNPGKLNFGTSGVGTGQHLSGELFQSVAGFKMAHVPYKAGGAQMIDLLSGVIDVVFEYPSVVKPQIDGGKLRPLALTSDKPMKSFPGVKTVADSGYPGFQFSAWSAILLPANAPPDVVSTLATAFAAALRDPAVVKYFDDTDSLSLVAVGPDTLPAFMASQAEKFAAIVKASGASAD